MTDQPRHNQTDAPVDSADAIPRHTTPTWEMELLVSGATTFGLLQLPSLLDRSFFHLINGVAFDYAELLKPMWIYSKVALVTLILTFLAHLCLRGYWVALVGMNSVYPGGVRWDKLRLGPLARRVAESAAPDAAAAIEFADNRATRVFGTGVGVAMLMLIPIMMVAVGLAGVVAMRALFGADIPVGKAFISVLVALLLPGVLASLADKHLSGLLREDSLAGRLAQAILAVYAHVGIGGRSNPLVALYVSHEGRLRMALTMVVVIGGVMTVILAPLMADEGSLPIFDDSLHSDAQSQPAYYADSDLDRAIYSPRPWIESRVAAGPYVQLFVPFLPRRQLDAMRTACPGRSPDIDCLAKVCDLRLDGGVVTAPFEMSADPQTGQRGAVVMVPVAALAVGRHELSLARPGERNEDGSPVDRDRIAFWK
ncbi:hypothetical protein BH11PSE14_BH11PSE14_13060 [soil metagenome]